MPDRRLLSSMVILASLCFAGVTTPAAEAQAVEGTRPQLTIQQFMQELNNYGEWFHVPEWGWAWQPHDIQPWWVPYTEGEWQYSSEGPYWVSYKAYGWAVFHYGRWADHEHFGWIWLPDTRWGPGFVCWREGKGYLGWAPMPPQQPGNVGIAESGCEVAAKGWSFIIDNFAFFQNVEPHIVPRARNVNLLTVTEPVANYRESDLAPGPVATTQLHQRQRAGVDPHLRSRADRQGALNQGTVPHRSSGDGSPDAPGLPRGNQCRRDADRPPALDGIPGRGE
ncbi:MAG: hypothetical protein MK085_10505 [Phycisphaerales bacterium]|nr:hypothetical protein [Phycisphaerales bacterium]